MTKLRQQSSTTLTYEPNPNRIRFKFRKIQAFQSDFFFRSTFVLGI